MPLFVPKKNKLKAIASTSPDNRWVLCNGWGRDIISSEFITTPINVVTTPILQQAID